ncbi:transmembrane sensor [Pseudomonas hunanensis]|uniref:Transmembrane sensor n=1 Tax=Pseudomonas hunanensis TaxID=1247546 RepID=A0ACC6K5C7_9PSED|nr:FecR domain-containing protein [Pseudomonas hunanensis]MDR6713684.1 transmembrane sensor [Pseudomonas hunanensis]
MAIQPSFRVMEQAAEWYAELRCGDADAAEHAACRRWLAADPAHRAAWESVQAISRRFEPFEHLADRRHAADNLIGANQRVRRRAVLRCLAALAGAGVLWSSWRLTPLPSWRAGLMADYRTGLGELKCVRLPDGSQAWLNTSSGFNIDFAGTVRALQLVRGEVLIDTAHDARRPFIVSTAQGTFQALGTRFSVRIREDQSELLVFAGAVQVRLAATGQTRVVEAGQQQLLSAAGLAEPGRASLAREAWSEGMLVAADIPLGEVLDELSRYHFGHIAVSPQVAALKVFGNLPLSDVDSALAMLAASLPISIEKPLPWWTTVRAREA